MKHLILSDMHGNAEALRAVLEAAGRRRFDRVLVLGDLVGYGAEPNEVVEQVRALADRAPLVAVRGNHDKVVAGVDPGHEFNEVALSAARWTTARLSPENLRFVRDLPPGPLPVSGDLAICHGSPLDEDAYVFSPQDAWRIFERHRIGVTFFGHTHVPSVFASGGGRREVRVARLGGARGALRLEPGHRYLINPGSIGQPRDRDARAAFMTYDEARRLVSWYRIPYAAERARDRIVEAGLPRALGERLLLGI